MSQRHVCERRLCPGAVEGSDKEYKDDSAKGMDPEKAAKASAGGSSRGSAQFLSEVEGQRAIKVRISTCLPQNLLHQGDRHTWR